MRRRDLAPALAGLWPKSERKIEGGFVHEAADIGHRLRDRARMASPRERRSAEVVIVGGGISGLASAWRLRKRGFRDFVLLELEQTPGGNSRWGANSISRFPWAAHYLPVPGNADTYVRELCQEFGLLKEGQFDERWLCHSPQERLFIHGRWQEGLEPLTGATAEDIRQMRRFDEQMRGFASTGAFTLPLDLGLDKAAPALRALDGISMLEWMRREGFSSEPLRWLIDYSTRDDYGTHSDAASAFAGIHYFASRPHEEKGPLTWPEGNGWLMGKLLAFVREHVRTGAMVHRIEREGARWNVWTETTLWQAPLVIFAAPTFLAGWLVHPAPPRYPLDAAPWMVANLSLDRWPRNHGFDYAWDNVLYRSSSLGYVIATHQSLESHQPRTVWTYYWALADGNAVDQRRILLGGDWTYWKERILNDLERAHPDIRQCVSRIDIFRIGHAMPRPAPGSMFSEARRSLCRHSGTLVYANSDLSGLSLFEEAVYRGFSAADYVLRKASSTGGR